MKILFDQGTLASLRRHLMAHEVTTAFERGWQTLANGELLAAAEAAGVELTVTTDKNLRYQQNLEGRRISILVLWTTDWRRIERDVGVVAQAVGAVAPGAYVELTPP